jgi:hypothetical protein
MYASIYGNFEIAKFLIENNGDLNIQTKVFFFKKYRFIYIFTSFNILY